jgi:uncharacterized protein YjcR
MSHVHPLARTTPRTRCEIKASFAPLTEVAERYNITVATARKWRQRDDPQDRSHRPRRLSTTLSPAQELLAVELNQRSTQHRSQLFVQSPLVCRRAVGPRNRYAFQLLQLRSLQFLD